MSKWTEKIENYLLLALLLAGFQFYGLPFLHYFMNGQHPALLALRDHLTKNLPEYITFLAALSIAVVCTWPKMIPQTAQDWWTWARDAFQTAVPATRRHDNPPDPPPPNPKKEE